MVTEAESCAPANASAIRPYVVSHPRNQPIHLDIPSIAPAPTLLHSLPTSVLTRLPLQFTPPVRRLRTLRHWLPSQLLIHLLYVTRINLCFPLLDGESFLLKISRIRMAEVLVDVVVYRSPHDLGGALERKVSYGFVYAH